MFLVPAEVEGGQRKGACVGDGAAAHVGVLRVVEGLGRCEGETRGAEKRLKAAPEAVVRAIWSPC